MCSQIASQALVSTSVFLVPVAAVVHGYSIIFENHNEDTPSFSKGKTLIHDVKNRCIYQYSIVLQRQQWLSQEVPWNTELYDSL